MDQKMANIRIDESKLRLARTINQLERVSNDIKFICGEMDWNDDVAFVIDEASTRLGQALATLVTWDEDIEEDQQ